VEKNSWPKRTFGIAAFLLLAAFPGFAADNSPDTTAQFLAGLAAPAARVDAAVSDNPWAIHALELSREWKRTDEQLSAIANWAPDALGTAYREDSAMFYMFSGPDFLYAHAFFPNARTYILCGTEPIGAIPDLDKIAPEALPSVLAELRKSLQSVLDWSFFITKDMKTDLAQPQLGGTIPLLYVFLARAGCTIDSVTPVTVDRTGALSEDGKGETSGVRIEFTSSSSSRQTLYYFCSDLSDDGIKANPGFLRFCEQQGKGVALLKAASYLLHQADFSRVREFLLERSDTILQDDSGVPLRFFEGPNWTVRYCGQYAGPIRVFEKDWQPDLAKEFRRNATAPLPFGFGYQWQPSRSGVMIVRRREAELGQIPVDASSG
jgi:hypothetical protein